METFTEIVEKLTMRNETIATMESCTGGAVVDAITSVPGASEVLKYSAVTYSNEFKIKMGVDPDIINTYTVYSEETAKEMSKCISNYANSDYGVGVTGKFNRVDKRNPRGADDVVFVSIYVKSTKEYHTSKVLSTASTRKENKLLVVKRIENMLDNLLK